MDGKWRQSFLYLEGPYQSLVFTLRTAQVSPKILGKTLSLGQGKILASCNHKTTWNMVSLRRRWLWSRDSSFGMEIFLGAKWPLVKKHSRIHINVMPIHVTTSLMKIPQHYLQDIVYSSPSCSWVKHKLCLS